MVQDAPAPRARHPRLRERETELRAVAAAIGALRAGRGGLLVVTAPAGLGKTRILDAMAAGARAGRCTVCRTAGTELTRPLPFGAASALLRPWLAAADPDARDAVLTGAAAGAGALLADGSPVVGAVAELDAQMTVVHALQRTVANIGERERLVLLVDDLHWVDEPSLRFVASLARQATGLGILLGVALRPGVSPAAETAVAVPHARVLRPAALSAPAAASVVDEVLPAAPGTAFAAACTTVTGGNPLLLRELLHALVEEGVRGADADAGRVHDVGAEPARWIVRSMLGQLDGDAVRLARAVAILGPGPVADAATVARLDATTATPALAAGRRCGLLTDTGPVDVVHPLLRHAVLAETPTGERSRLELRAARLRVLAGDAALAGAHLLAVPPGGRAWVVDALADAARHARRRAAPSEAARLLDRALAEPPPPARSVGTLAAAARAQAAAGRTDAPGTFEAAIAAAPGDDRPRLLLELAWVHQAHGRFDAAADAAQRGLDAGPRDEELGVELAAMHDATRLWSPGPAAAVASAVAARVGRPVGGRAERAALADAARRHMFAGDDHVLTAELALRAWDDGALLAESSADDPAGVRVAFALLGADRYAEVLAIADACLKDAQRRASPMAHATWRHLRGHGLAQAGVLDEAEADLHQALTAHEHGWGALLPGTTALLVTVRLERGDVVGAHEALAIADRSDTHPRTSPMWAVTDAARGRLLLAQGDPAAAVELLLAAGRRGIEELGALNPALGPWRADATRALAALGRDDEARTQGDAEVAAARRFGAPRALSQALRARATVASDAVERRALLEEAAAVSAPSQSRIEHAWALLELGEDLRQRDTVAARETLRLALDAADRCAADGLASRARAQLIAAGGRPRRRRLAGPESLTVGERRVALLARDGLSNRAIADELFVTPKAVAFHLGNAYRKLGIGSRRELDAVL
ncbi:AAA family ATPase [Conexibacter sp. W3-3-2]|uniref:AAA family ATPase n=1 Tax=Conexibacter sp. W3-3-2 TaxID=2675227 RepID=UPI0012B7E90B|nr:LuxR family transcriptional regulator [Conexibacter sp. W3-3-2]MTD42946.1 AAA family ATPase [Conexibacter sp. W3-3-2]